MAYDQNTICILYRKLLGFYPREFRKRLGESMEQTFHDLCMESKGQPGRGFFLLAKGDLMKGILANPTSAAITSFILALPIGLLRLILGSDIEPLIAPIESALTVDGIPNALGYTVICGGMLLLPVAFILNLRPMLKREGFGGPIRFYVINLIVGAIILLLIAFTWGALLVEEIYCLRGIRCD